MNNDYTHVSIVLDASGSMDIIKNSTMFGFNSFVENNANLPGKFSFLLTKFNQHSEPGPLVVGNVVALTGEDYRPSGVTALYDAIAKTINKTGQLLNDMPEQDRPGKVIFLIVTDGQENASREFNRDQVFKMIQLQQETYKWEFVFMGANQDAYAVAASIGVPQGQSLNYGYNNVQAQSAWSGMTVNTVSYRTGDRNTLSFTDDQIVQAK